MPNEVFQLKTISRVLAEGVELAAHKFPLTWCLCYTIYSSCNKNT